MTPTEQQICFVMAVMQRDAALAKVKVQAALLKRCAEFMKRQGGSIGSWVGAIIADIEKEIA
jgi:hypothetical protein